MADKASPQKDVESPVVDDKVVEKEKVKSVDEKSPVEVEDESKSENGDNAENGEPTDKENGKDEKVEEDAAEKVCCVKRKSGAGGDAPDGTPAEGVTPEKKAKLDETAEAELNGEAEVAA